VFSSIMFEFSHHTTDPVPSSIDGVFLTREAKGPKDIPDSVARDKPRDHGSIHSALEDKVV